MPRQARPTTPGFPHHLISRFVNHEYRMHDDEQRAAFLRSVARAYRVEPVRFCAYGLMSSHTHNVVMGEQALGGFLHRVNCSYARWWNDKHDQYGPVFAERPWSNVISVEEGLARTVAYTHNNPPRAGLVNCPSDSTRTSHRAFLGLVECPPFLDVKWTLAAMGFSSSNSGRQSFHEYVCSRTAMPRDPSIAGPGESSHSQAQRLIEAAANELGVTLQELTHPRRAELSEARLVLVATALEVFGSRVDHFAEAAGLSGSMVSRLRKQAAGRSSQTLVDAYLQFDPVGS